MWLADAEGAAAAHRAPGVEKGGGGVRDAERVPDGGADRATPEDEEVAEEELPAPIRRDVQERGGIVSQSSLLA